MCKKYKLQAKRPPQKVYTEWCSTDDYEAIKRNIKTIESLGWQWELRIGEEENDQRETD